MNFQEAAEYIEHLQMFTKKHTLDHTEEFLKRLGNPEAGRKVIHVAGTNGKGSVCADIQAILLSEKKKTGMFISPHLISIRERIQINGIPVTEEQFLSVFQDVLNTVQKMEEDGLTHPTYFEFLFGMAMKAFACADVEYIILETGLGGRLDATNSIKKPVLTIITSIGMDHMDILGDTIEKIAGEKAGIIKQGVPLIMDGSNQKAAAVLKKAAENAGVFCREITENAYEIQKITGKYIAFSSANLYDDTAEWKIPMAGIYQPMNAILALEAVSVLFHGKKHCANWKKALENVVWPARMEEISPGVILDGAHNMPAVIALADSIKARFAEEEKKGRLIVLFSALQEKQYEEIIKYICREIPADLFIVTEVDSYRRVAKEELKRDFEKYTEKPVFIEDTSEKAWKHVMMEKTEEDIVYCFGSLYLAGEMEALLRRSEDAEF